MMTMTISVDNSHDLTKNRIWYKKMELHPGLNLLFGGNGAGKTSTFKLILSRVRTEWSAFKELPHDALKISVGGSPFKGKVYSFSNSENNVMRRDDDGVFSLGSYGLTRKMQGFEWSEGMNVSVAVYDFLYALENGFESGSLILIDEIDSGLDAHSCSLIAKEIKRILRKRMRENGDVLYVLLSFNQYEIAHSSGEKTWINIYSGEREKIAAVCNSYEEYLSYLSKCKKEHRRIGDELAWGESEEKYNRGQKKLGKI